LPVGWGATTSFRIRKVEKSFSLFSPDSLVSSEVSLSPNEIKQQTEEHKRMRRKCCVDRVQKTTKRQKRQETQQQQQQNENDSKEKFDNK
jgi:hypothetical protein